MLRLVYAFEVKFYSNFLQNIMSNQFKLIIVCCILTFSIWCLPSAIDFSNNLLFYEDLDDTE